MINFVPEPPYTLREAIERAIAIASDVDQTITVDVTQSGRPDLIVHSGDGIDDVLDRSPLSQE